MDQGAVCACEPLDQALHFLSPDSQYVHACTTSDPERRRYELPAMQ
jgi:hypothetical protein